MDVILISPFIQFLHGFSPEILSIFIFIICIGCILFSLRAFGLFGLYAYNVVIIIAANIQVLKVATFAISPEPVALGTITFATAFLVSDIITEHYGKEAAIRGVWITFWTQILMTIMMMLTIGFRPCAGDPAHAAMTCLFMPSPRLLIASLAAFLLSQCVDIFLFQWFKTKTGGRLLWLRQNASMSISALVDNTIFSVIAWVALSPTPVGVSSLVFTYILGTYVSRVFVSICSTPVMYLSRRFVPHE